MAVTKLSNSGLTVGITKYDSFLAGNSAFMPGSYESIATVTLGSASSSITFASIPSTYKHLQLRFMIKSQSASNDFSIGMNGSFSVTNSSSHILYGNGSSAYAGAWTSQSYVSLPAPGSSPSLTSAFPSGSVGAGIIDILDYANTNKTKVLRALWGSDQNGAGFVALNSGSLNTTSAMTELDLFNGYNWAAGSSFALYGVK